MSMKLVDIQAPITYDMADFESTFRTSMRTNVMLLDKIMHYIVKRKGKQMRPMFVFLSANLTGKTNEVTHRGAALIELLHTATLVHDDVVDDSNYRRGFFSVNALWKNKIAVLVGDYLLSKGLLLAIENEDFHSLKIVSKAVKEMSEGELLQIEKARKLDITEEVYFDVIRQKTASLIASCCAVGVASTTDDKNLIDKAYQFGQDVGIAFQIKDDLFDYGAQDIGKPVGIDIKEKKMTLPLIYALTEASKKQQRHIRNLIKNKSHKREAVKEVIAFVKASSGLDYTQKKMNEYLNKALTAIEGFPASESRESLIGLLHYTISRKK